MNGVVVWLTGLPASGKSTLAGHARAALAERGDPCCVLDSDAVRAAVFPTLGYEEAARDTFYEALAQMAALLAAQGLCVLVAATASRQRWRDRARSLAPRFVEVFVSASEEQCAERDPKGLYRAAQEGHAVHLPGVGTVYEPPPAPEITARGGDDPEALTALLARI